MSAGGVGARGGEDIERRATKSRGQRFDTHAHFLTCYTTTQKSDLCVCKLVENADCQVSLVTLFPVK